MPPASFNGDLSKWNTSRVKDISYMFYGAASFNQVLCAGGIPSHMATLSSFSKDQTSNCTFQDTPQLDQRGPFCA